MGIAMKIMAFIFFLNLAIPIVAYAGTGNWEVNGIQYDENSYGVESLGNDFDEDIGTPPVEEDSYNFGDQLLNFVTLGSWLRIKVFLKNTIFALPNLLVNLGIITSYIAGFINVMIVFVYVIGMIELFTGKDLLGFRNK